MSRIKQITAVVFCMLFFGGALATLLLPDRESSVMENRELAQKPKVSMKKFLQGSYQKKYEAYLSDQFFLRDKWVNLSSAIQFYAGKKEINGVYLGKGGYLLERNQEEEFDAEQTEENIAFLSSFLNDMAEEYGKEHVSCIMIPSKAAALPNRLPAFAEVEGQEKVLESLRDKLSYPEMLVDMQEILQKHQKEYIYYRTDHHWTTLGAYYAYQAWAEKTGQAVSRSLKDYQRETVFHDFYGTTYNKAHVPVRADSVELFHSPIEETVHINMDDGEKEADSFYFCKEALKGFNRYNVFLSKNTFKIEVTSKAEKGKTLLLIKDSFANCFVPFLAQDYERIIMIDYRYGKVPVGSILSDYEDIIDVLVMFNTEKFMKNTKLAKLADTERKSKTMEEFNIEDFLE